MAGHDITDEDWLTERLADVTEEEIDLFMDRVDLGHQARLSLLSARIAGLEYVTRNRIAPPVV